jgi:hypothetical protein
MRLPKLLAGKTVRRKAITINGRYRQKELRGT